VARERAADVLDPDDPERPEPEWDATQPHVPFPMLGETQAISTTQLLSEQPSEPSGPSDGNSEGGDSGAGRPPQAYAPPPELGEGDDGAGGGADDGADDVVSVDPARDPARSVPVVASDGDVSPFEIDEVEALPEEADGVLDLHEGASDFVPVSGQHARKTSPTPTPSDTQSSEPPVPHE
jgi:hypothetical protein